MKIVTTIGVLMPRHRVCGPGRRHHDSDPAYISASLRTILNRDRHLRGRLFANLNRVHTDP